MKKFIALLLTLVIVLSLSACGLDTAQIDTSASKSTPSSTASIDKTTPPETTATPEVTVSPAASLESSGVLGDFGVQINDFELGQDYDGNPAILIAYTFTNSSEENTSAMFNVLGRAYQNGVELDSAIIMDNDSYSSEDLMKDVQPGVSIGLKEAYVLTSKTAPVEFEMTEAISFSDEKLGKTFEISEGGVTEMSVAPTGDTTESIGDCSVSVVSHKLTEDYEGQKAILIELGFTNNSDEATSFASSISFTAFQDGIELESAILFGDDSGSGNSMMRNVKPGAGTAVTVAYILTSETSPVAIEIEEYFSFSGKKIETEISIAE